MRVRADDEEVRDVAKQRATISDCAARDRDLNIAENGQGGRHGPWRAGAIDAERPLHAPAVDITSILPVPQGTSWPSPIVTGWRKFPMKGW